ncbi:MAG: hypothetical protein KC586_20735, partial [Myxococcales bacterium]|nr:hypothetical protein [Myxococcales bacterium]
MPRTKPGVGKGVLHPGAGVGKFEVRRFHPDPDLAPFVEHLWTVRWDLGDAPPFVQRTLPDPAVHIVFERDRSEIVGVVRGRFERVLVGAGRVFSAKLHPGGLAWLGAEDASRLTNRRVAVDALFAGVDVAAREAAILGAASEEAMAVELQAFLRSVAPRASAEAARA